MTENLRITGNGKSLQVPGNGESLRVPENLAGSRLDYVLRQLLPDVSARAARRMIEGGLVKISGKTARAGVRARAGEIIGFGETGGGADACVACNGASLLAIEDEYCFFYKPRGMHTVSLAGGNNWSLERASVELLKTVGVSVPVRLLQRLDFGTCGIVAGALSEKAAAEYRLAERGGECVKIYAAVLSGCLEEAVWAKKRLDCNGGKAARWRDIEAESPLEWTFFEPLAHAEGKTLARCVIRMGKRHQVRAHAASIGHPLVGDELYGGLPAEHFWLEHYCLRMPGKNVFRHETDCGLEALFPQSGGLLAVNLREEETCTS